jgi:hypothetical protein
MLLDKFEVVELELRSTEAIEVLHFLKEPGIDSGVENVFKDEVVELIKYKGTFLLSIFVTYSKRLNKGFTIDKENSCIKFHEILLRFV